MYDILWLFVTDYVTKRPSRSFLALFWLIRHTHQEQNIYPLELDSNARVHLFEYIYDSVKTKSKRDNDLVIAKPEYIFSGHLVSETPEQIFSNSVVI